MIEIEHNLIKRCRKGERKAQLQLYTTFYKRIYNSCFRILRNKEDAEDAMQESFIKAFFKLDKYENNVPFESWIVRIAVNTAIDKLRETKPDFIDYNTVLQDYIEDTTNEEWELIQEKAKQVKQAIDQLPDNSRIIISLYLIEGYDHEEIAQILQIQPGTARIQYLRAKQKLIEFLKEKSNIKNEKVEILHSRKQGCF
jgi:RNA polymerase sigma-70 factor (ECF subfamily)